MVAFSENTKKLLEANLAYADSFGDKADLSSSPARKMAVVGCMDTRIDYNQAMGLKEGDSHMIRNAGGRVNDDFVRSVLASTLTMGVKEVYVIPHTGCGMAYLNEDSVGEKALATLTAAGVPEQEAKVALSQIDVDWQFIDDEAGTLMADVLALTTLRNEGIIPADVKIIGMSYDVHTGKLVLDEAATKAGASATPATNSNNFNQIVASNNHYAVNFGDKGSLASAPARETAVVTCMDTRMDPNQYFGTQEGDVHSMRNAGARVTDDVVRSLMASTLTMGVKEIHVVPHTGCGMAKLNPNSMADIAVNTLVEAGATEADAKAALQSQTRDFMFIEGEEETLLEDVKKLVDLREKGMLPPNVAIFGHSYNTHAGVVTPNTKACELGAVSSETPAAKKKPQLTAQHKL